MPDNAVRSNPAGRHAIACSYVPTALKCPQSVNCDISVDSFSEASVLGRLTHELIAEWFRSGTPVDVTANQKALAYDIRPDSDKVQEACYLASRAIEFYREHEPAMKHGKTMVEIFASRDNLVGILDWIRISDDVAYIIDWKTGRSTSDLSQLCAYAYVSQSLHNAKTTWVCMVNLASLEYNACFMSQSQIEEWKRSLDNRLRSNGFSIGPWCQYCKRVLDCPALDQAMESLGYQHEASKLPEVYSSIRAIQRRCEMASEAIKARLHALGGSVSNGSYALELRETIYQKIKANEAWPILLNEVGQDTLLSCVEIGKTALEGALASLAPRGQKGKKIASVFEMLKEANAIEEKRYTSIAIRDVQEGNL